MLKYTQTKSQAGSKADSLWTTTSGYAENPGRGSVSLNPNLRYIEKMKIKKRSTRTNLLAIKPLRKSVTSDPLGVYAGKKNEPRGGNTCWLHSQNGGRSRGDPWGQVPSSNKKGGQTEMAGGLGSQLGVDNMRP